MFVARWVCEEIHSESVPSIAADLLELGHDSPALRRLAAEPRLATWSIIEPLMLRLLKEFNLPSPFPPDLARLLFTRQIAREAIAGFSGPWEALARVERVWNFDLYTAVGDVASLASCVDDVFWDETAQEYRPTEMSDVLDAFARIGSWNDDQISEMTSITPRSSQHFWPSP
jgi:hypothetical protein